MKTWTIITLAAMAALGIGCAVDLQESHMTFGDDSLGVTGFPRIVGILLAVSSLAYLVHTVVRGTDATSLKGKADYRSVIAFGLSVLYILGVCYFGFRTSTFLYLLILPPLFEKFQFSSKRAFLWFTTYALIVTVVFHGFFKVFKVYLPPTIFF